MCIYEHKKLSKDHENKINMTPPKEINKAPVTDTNEMKIYELLDKNFRIILFINFREIQEHTERQLNEIKKTMFKQNEIETKNRNHKKTSRNYRAERYNGWNEEFNREFQN